MLTKMSLQNSEDFLLTLGPGEDIYKEIEAFFRASGYRELIITSAIGSMLKAVLNYPRDKSLPPVIESKEVEGPFEIASMVGTVRYIEDDKVHIHMHGSVADRGDQIYGGALARGCTTYKMLELIVKGVKE